MDCCSCERCSLRGLLSDSCCKALHRAFTFHLTCSEDPVRIPKWGPESFLSCYSIEKGNFSAQNSLDPLGGLPVLSLIGPLWTSWISAWNVELCWICMQPELPFLELELGAFWTAVTLNFLFLTVTFSAADFSSLHISWLVPSLPAHDLPIAGRNSGVNTLGFLLIDWSYSSDHNKTGMKPRRGSRMYW